MTNLSNKLYTLVPQEVIDSYDLQDELENVATIETGHINRSVRTTWRKRSGEMYSLLHQRINSTVFPDAKGIAENIERALPFIRKNIDRARGEKLYEVLSTRREKTLSLAEDGASWRTIRWLDSTYTLDLCTSSGIAFEIGFGFGRFVRQLSDAKPEDFNEVLPNFHEALPRFDQLEKVAKISTRLSSCSSWATLAMDRKQHGVMLNRALADTSIPLRVVHNDTKMNNILLDSVTHKAVCVVDLDTIQPGSLLYDFGDMVRSLVVTVPEDYTGEDVDINLEYYEGVVAGFCEAARSCLTEGERELLAVAPAVFAYVLGTRFLTDHLAGDVYFKVHRENQNLDRARTQLRLGEVFRRREQELLRLLKRYW